jgi:hypothetical protein
MLMPTITMVPAELTADPAPTSTHMRPRPLSGVSGAVYRLAGARWSTEG